MRKGVKVRVGVRVSATRNRERDELGKKSRVRLDELRPRKETIRTSEEFNDGARCVKKAILSANGENRVNIRGENLHEESERGCQWRE